ncbi:MAG: hypothetical protein WC596_01705 [Candidatus Shapirobacteria bacterium]
MPLFDDLNQPQDNKLTEQYQDILKKYSDYLKPASPADEILQEPITSPPAPSSPSSPVPPLPPVLSDIIDTPPIDAPSGLPPSQPIPEVNQEMAVSRPDSGNFFKIFFYLTLVIFLIVVGLLAYNYLKNSSPKTVDLTPTSTPATPTIGPGCDLNDKKYPVGGSFPAADGCNICTCGEDLLFTCTETICSATPSTSSAKKPIPTATSSAITKDWKTYEDKKAGFSIKYPKDWNTITSGQIVSISNSTHTVSFKPIVSSFSDWLISLATDIKFINSTINGYKTHAATNLPNLTDNYSVLIENPSGKQIIMVNLSPYSATPEFQKVKETFDQMLSTFKFTD